MTMSVKSLQESIKNLLEYVSGVSKVTSCKISKQKWTAFLYTDNKFLETEKKKYKTIYNHCKENKILRCTLNEACTGSLCWKLQNANERNLKRPNYTGSHMLFMDCNAQHRDVNSP